MSALLPVEAAYEQYQRNEITYAEYRVIADRDDVAQAALRERQSRRASR